MTDFNVFFARVLILNKINIETEKKVYIICNFIRDP